MTGSSARTSSKFPAWGRCARFPGDSRVPGLLSSFSLFLLLTLLLIGCNGVSSSGDANMPTSPSRLLITSSSTLLPLIRAAAALFERQHPEAQITLQQRESRDGLSALAHRQADIAATALYDDPAAGSSAGLSEQLLCVVPFVIIVHPDVSLASLSRQQLLRIFSTGEITNWKQIGGPDQKVTVLTPPLASDINLLFREEVLGDAAEVGTALPANSLETLDEMVARTPGSISYLPGVLLDARVHEVAIDGIQPSARQIAAGQYPFWSFGHLYTWDDTTAGMDKRDTEGAMRSLFLRFMQTSPVEQLIQELGYIPLAQMPISDIAVSSLASAIST